MATQKPISTISYNTESFLREKLDNLINAHIIQAYQYIFHKGEDGDKDHIHLRIEPNKRLDPMDLAEQFREFQLGKEKPLGCRPFRPSKEEDWFLYAVHDKQYLKLKYSGGEKGEKLPYKWQDIQAPEDYDVEIAFIRAKSHLEHTSVNIANRLRNGEQPINLALEGENPFTVNAVNRLLFSTDYQRIAAELAEIRLHYEKLKSAVIDYGLTINIDANGDYIIEPVCDEDGVII